MPKAVKKPKDKNAPKKPMSSYFLFSNERRGQLQQIHTDKKITELSKMISVEWKEITAETKLSWEAKAKAAKAVYQEKWEAYIKTEDYTRFQKILAEWKLEHPDEGKKGKKGKGAPKKPKQPEMMPKRPQSSYFIFSNQRRDQLRESYPDKKITELSKMISAEWRAKTDAEKEPYVEKAKELKEEYNIRIAKYKEGDEYKAYDLRIQDWRHDTKMYKKALKNGTLDDDGDFSMKITMPRKPKDAKCPKKPLSSYFLFAAEVRDATKQEYPDLKITEIAKKISAKWKLLDEEQKKPYNEEALVLKEAYKLKIAEYKKSEDAQLFAQKLEEWKAECENRKQKARAKALKKKNKKKSPKKKRTTKKKAAPKKKKAAVTKGRYDETSSDSESDSSASSGSESSSNSDSDSDSSSDSDSDSSSE